MDNLTTGRLGEKAAAEYLVSQGCFVVERNYRPAAVRHEEIDIIACDGNYIIFAEVKTRRKKDGSAQLAVNAAKQKRLILCARQFLLTHTSYKCYQPRFDVLCVTVADGIVTDIEHYKNAFMT